MGKQLNDVELWNRYIHNGRPIALRNKLAENNLNIIHDVIRQTSYSCPALLKEDRDDLFQQGYFGLNSAIEKFELGEGRYFYKFAFPFVYGRLMSWLRDKSRIIRVPVVKHDITMRCFKCKEKLIASGVNSPTLKQIFQLVPDNDKELGYEKWSAIIKAWDATQTTSMDDLLSVDEDASPILSKVESKDYAVCKAKQQVVTLEKDIYKEHPVLKGIALSLNKHPVFKKDGRPVLQKGKYASEKYTKAVLHFNRENLM